MPESTSTLDPASELAARILFGDELLAALGPGFVRSLTEQPAAWASALTSIWTISRGAGHDGNGAAPAPAPVAVAPVAAAPAPPPAIATAPRLADPPAELDFFDPSAGGEAEPAVEKRSTPWEYEEVRAEFVKLLEEATGYPAEVLDDDADLEADLAIDSVKQVEALGKLREHYQLLFEEDFSIVDHRTIRSLAGHLTDRLNRERLAAVSA
ncbi:acyl carrier protein [Lentzea californiensis]|uniref:acyl carrier protein n=1 Tax=Lentzea californiensis TaxID=438851 RepID=UPI0021650FCD|nr:phosphopantetheine-binding protein [Lentzea californiensis]MCR3752092.1 Phosphopantetheine attachment site [Lentzea californiensis]